MDEQSDKQARFERRDEDNRDDSVDRPHTLHCLESSLSLLDSGARGIRLINLVGRKIYRMRFRIVHGIQTKNRPIHCNDQRWKQIHQQRFLRNTQQDKKTN